MLQRGYPSVSDSHYVRLHPGFVAPSPETSGLFDFVGDAVSGIGDALSTVASPIVSAVETVAAPVLSVVKPIAGAITNNPVWDLARTGVSFIPGVGSAVAGGMSALSAAGKGASLADIALQAAKGAIPGGPLVTSALDAAVGALQGRNVADSVLSAIKSQLPGGPLAQAAFDAGTVIAKGALSNSQHVAAVRAPLSAEQKQVFDKAIAAAKAAKAPATVTFPALSGSQQATARKMQVLGSNALKTPMRTLAYNIGVPTNDVRKAASSFLNRWGKGAVTTMHNVGESQTLEQAAEAAGVQMDHSDFGTNDTGEMSFGLVKNQPSFKLNLEPRFVQALYDHGSANVKKAVLAHGLLARGRHSTGELEPATGKWILKSGDTGWSIAKKLTGDGNRWKELPAVNPGMKVTGTGTNQQLSPWAIGQRVTIPSSWLGTAVPVPVALPNVIPVDLPGILASIPTVLPSATNPDVPIPAMGTQYYTVKSGDSLSKIAQSYTGVSSRWTELYAIPENKKTIGADPNKIQIGQRLVIPPTWIVSGASLPGPSSLPTTIPLPAPGPAVPTASGVPTIAAAQAMLAFFYSRHGQEVPTGLFASSSVPTFGSDPDDLEGVWNDRSVEATRGFQSWFNAHLDGRTPLSVDGIMGQHTAASLQEQNARDLLTLGTSVPATTPTVTLPPSIPIPTTLPTTPPTLPTTLPTLPTTLPTLPTITQTSTKPPTSGSGSAKPAEDSGSGIGILLIAAAAALALSSK